MFRIRTSTPIRRTARLFGATLFLATLLVSQPAVRSLDIQLDYSFDANSFFVGHLDRQLVLEQAAQVFESTLTDMLTGITPSGSNSWTAIFDHPSTGAEVSLPNETIAAGTLRVYAGGQSLAGSTLGTGGPGGFSASGSSQFLNTLRARGQSGALANPATDFGPWGGSISFDLGTDWYFDADAKTLEDFGSRADFYSVAVHELAHLLGFGTAESWRTYEGATFFNGPASTAENLGARVPLSGDGGHWAEGTQSSVTSPMSLPIQDTAMNPTLTDGGRQYFTRLDFAGLSDVGWTVIPEPPAAALAVCGVIFIRWRKAGRHPRS